MEMKILEMCDFFFWFALEVIKSLMIDFPMNGVASGNIFN